MKYNINAMTDAETAYFFGVSIHTVRKWRRDHGLQMRPSMHALLTWAAARPFVMSSAARNECFEMLMVYRQARG